MSGPADEPRSTGSQFFGWLLMAIGGLMATLCGLCSLVFGIASFAGNRPAETFSPMLIVVIVLGAPPTVIGGFIFWAGYRLVWPKRKPVDPSDFD